MSNRAGFDPAGQKYVSLTTFRRDGTAVATPVWIAALDNGRFGFTTDASSWKVKRVRNNPAVELRPCSMRGTVAPDAPVVAAMAEIVSDPAAYKPVLSAIKKKYGLAARAVELGATLKGLITRKSQPDCALVLTLS